VKKERAYVARRDCGILKTKRAYFRRRSTAGVFAVFGQNSIGKIEQLYMSDGVKTHQKVLFETNNVQPLSSLGRLRVYLLLSVIRKTSISGTLVLSLKN